MPDNSSKNKIITVSDEEFAEELDKLKYCLKIGQVSYDQEKERLKSLDKRAENLIKYSTLLIAVTNLVVSLAGKAFFQIKDTPCVKNLYIILMLVIIGCLVLSLISQRPGKIKIFPDGKWMFENMQKENGKYATEQERVYELILRYSCSTNSLQKLNSCTMVFLGIAYFLYILSIVLLMILLVFTIGV